MKFEPVQVLKTVFKAIFLLLPIMILVTPMCYYSYTFGSFGLSHRNENWAFFGEFLSPFAAFSSSLVIVYLTYRLYTIERNRETPILSVSVGKESPIDKDAVTVLNRSTFIAFSIRVIFMYEKETDEVQFPTLIPNDKVSWNLPEKEGLTNVIIEYQNAQGKIFTVYPNTSVNKPFIFSMSSKNYKTSWFCKNKKIKPFRF